MIPKDQIPKTVDVQIVRKIEQERNGTINLANECLVLCPADSDTANILLRKLTAGVKVVKNRFIELKQPATETLRQIRILEADILAPLETAKRDLNSRLFEWRTAERIRVTKEQAIADAKRREREALEEKHAEEGHLPPGPEPVIETPVPLEVSDTTRVRNQKIYKVEDLSKIPVEFCFTDLAKIRRKMSLDIDEDGFASTDIGVWSTSQPGVFLFLDGKAIKKAKEIPGLTLTTKEVPVYA